MALAASLAMLGCARDVPGGGADGLVAADRATGSAVAEALAADAWLLAPNRPALQGEAAAAFLRAEPPEGRVERVPLVAGVSADGRHGYTAGRIVEQAPAPTGALHLKYLAYWHWSERDRRWRMAAYIVNPSPAAPDSAPDPHASAHRNPRDPGGEPGTADALRAADLAFSARAGAEGAAAAFREYAEPHALLLAGAGHGMVWGDSAIGAFIGQAIPPTDRLTWVPRAADVSPLGDLGFTVGDATYRSGSPEGGSTTAYTKYLTIWRRQPDGGWRYAADAGNLQPAADGELGVERTAGGLRLRNPAGEDVFFTLFEQAMTAAVNWRPCVDRASCRFVPAGGERLVPWDSIPGYSPSADSATVFWWRASPGPERQAFDSVRSATVALRSR